MTAKRIKVTSVGSGESDDIESRAAAWVIRSSEGPFSDAEQHELDTWLSGDSRRLGAYVRAQAIWVDVARVAAMGGLSAAPVPPRRVRHWQPMAMAASLCALMVGGYVGYDHFAGRISTGRGEVRQVALDDGSIIFLNGDSTVQVRYSKDERHVILRGGEASFRVAHNKARPFIVSAEGVSVRAVGTEFAVSMEHGDDVAVTVAEGVVKVDDAARNGPPRQQYLARNQQLVAPPGGMRRANLDPGEVGRQLAWRDGMLVFRGQMLGAAAEEVTRYAAVPVVINDPTLGRAEFMGVFHVGDSRAFAEAAAAAFNGEVSEVDGKLILARRQNSPSH